MEEETTEAGITGTRTVVDMEVVGGEEEAEVGKETGVGGGTSVGSSTGMTETETGTETGTGTRGKEVGINRALRTTTRATTPIIGDHIMTVTDLYANHSGVFSIHGVRSLTTSVAIPYVAMCNCCFFIV